MKHRQIPWDAATAALLLRGGVRFFLAGALTAARLASGSAPFALGFAAACGPGMEGLCALLGASAGALLFLDFSEGLSHVAAAILIYTSAMSMRELKLSRLPLFPGVCAAGFSLAVQGIYVLQSLNPAARVMGCLVSSALAGLSAWGYGAALHPREGVDRAAGRLFLTLTLLLAFSGLEVWGVSLSRAAIACLVLFCAYIRGAGGGAPAGLTAGLLTDLCAGEGLLYTSLLGCAGLAAGLRRGGSRVTAALLWLLAALAILAPAEQPREVSALGEMVLAAPVFLLLPRRAMRGKREKAEPAAEPALPRLRERLDRAAAAFRDLYDSLGRAAPASTDENPAIIFDRAAERVCRSCALCELCWKKDYTGTFNALNDATPYLLERGRALAKDFPNHFSSRCIHMTEFLEAINRELSAFLLRRHYRRQLEETRRSAKGQYAQLSDLLTATAANLEAVPVSAEEQPYSLGVALRPKAGERVCGDSVASFRTDGGLLCLLLSDGMGSGEPARRESALTCRLVQEFLEAGVGAEAALKTMNAALALRGQDTGSFSTIDLLTFQLRDGQTALYKYGAAPTYIKRHGSVRRITGSTLPAGLRTSPPGPDATRLTLEEGSFAVMVSDGVVDPDRDEWLQNLLAGWEGEDPQRLAGAVLERAVGPDGPDDDCGVQVLYLPENGGKNPAAAV